MNSFKKIFFIVFLVYISGLPSRLGFISQPLNELIVIFFAITGILSFSVYLTKFRYKVEILDILLLFYLLIYPVINSIIAYFTTGQPLYMGVLTFRGQFILFSYYTFLIFGFSKNFVLSYVEKTVIFIMILVAVLFYYFNLNDFNLLFRKGTVILKYGLTSTKGVQFSGYTSLFIIPFVAGWIYFFEKNRSRYLILPAVIFAFIVFISKARNEIMTLVTIPIIIYYIKFRFYDLKFLTFAIVLICALFIVIATDNVLSRSFSGLLRPTDLGFAQQTGDYSAYIRVDEFKSGWKWFTKYPIGGVGSISYRYNDGYMGFISDFFFLSDIGLMGVMVKGGLILLAFYLVFYLKLFRYFYDSDYYSLIGRYLVLSLVFELIIGNDYLVNYTGVLVILFLLKTPREPEVINITIS